MFRVCHVFLSVHCSLVVTDLLALSYVMFYCVFVTFPCGVLGQVWCLIVSIPDLCLLSYFNDTFLASPFTKRAASFCTFCTLLESCCVQPSHTNDTYSMVGNK